MAGLPMAQIALSERRKATCTGCIDDQIKLLAVRLLSTERKVSRLRNI